MRIKRNKKKQNPRQCRNTTRWQRISDVLLGVLKSKGLYIPV